MRAHGAGRVATSGGMGHGEWQLVGHGAGGVATSQSMGHGDWQLLEAWGRGSGN